MSGHNTYFQIVRPQLLMHVWCECGQWSTTVADGYVELPARHT